MEVLCLLGVWESVAAEFFDAFTNAFLFYGRSIAVAFSPGIN
jgi:hypothetical protein